MVAIVDDKSEHCIPFILDRLKAHREHHGENGRPFFLGLNGVQGAGKTTLVTTLCQTLRSAPHSLPTAVLSIDDLYLPHAQQTALAASDPSNPLIQHRGEPGTHDLALGRAVFDSLLHRQPTAIPFYDKSAFDGQGDRANAAGWAQVNNKGEVPVQVVVFEGWCVGFRALDDEVLEEKWRGAKAAAEEGGGGAYEGQLARHRLEHLKFVNERLREYDALTDMLDAFVHIDAENTAYVYDWRLQQEAALRAAKGTGMTDEQVVNFVNGYYPAYELYTDTLRAGIFKGDKGRQLRLVVGENRRVKTIKKL